MKRALILSGGGARGAFQVGVLKFLKEKKWNPDLICGTSVGAINAVATVSGMTLERTGSYAGQNSPLRPPIDCMMCGAFRHIRFVGGPNGA